MSTKSETVETSSFEWTEFYEAFADRLLAYRDKRGDLIGEIQAISAKNPGLPMIKLEDKFKDGTEGPLRDICPFTTVGIFNRGISDVNRRSLIGLLAKSLRVEVQVPNSFDGIPVVNNMSSHFFSFEETREPHAIDSLWEVFASALRFAESADLPDVRASLLESYSKAAQTKQVSWNLTMGLYWIRPRTFQTLDSRSRKYARAHGVPVPDSVKDNGEKYLALLDELSRKFQDKNFPVHSFQELSLAAWLEDSGENSVDTTEQGTEEESRIDEESNRAAEAKQDLHPLYSFDSILKDGCFLDREKIEGTLQRLREKKNLILQGPPGTGKTWLARRLAYALIGHKDDSKVRVLQFHPNISYEDFVRGWRPGEDGKLELVNGPLIEMIEKAKADPVGTYVMVVEEINRGNPAQIFGEMLTLLEADKREPSEALALTYRKNTEERVYIPENLYLIGTMNLADRSLAMVDFALRRRFAFVTLEPVLGTPWSDWVQTRCNIEPEVLLRIGDKLNALNRTLSDDVNLGPHFQVGHSFVTPSANSQISNAREWFRHVVETEIGPLLDEYWFDARETAQTERDRLLEGL